MCIGIIIEISIEISEGDHYMSIFTSRIFRLTLEITFSLKKYFFLQMAYDLHSQSTKLNKGMGGESPNKSGWAGKFFEKK